MITENYYGIYENFVPYHVCDDIVKRALFDKEEEGVIQEGINKQVRNSRVVWLNDFWIYDWITPIVHQCNKELGWYFTIKDPEKIQFTIYRENQFYGWHRDTFLEKDLNDQRKISVVIPLSNSDDYEGGNLEFYNSLASPTSKQEKIIFDEKTRTKGNIIIFPSYVYHQVTKVLKGKRMSLVIWYKGESWK